MGIFFILRNLLCLLYCKYTLGDIGKLKIDIDEDGIQCCSVTKRYPIDI